MLKLIVAMDKNYGIGKDNKLLVHNKEDMQRFKSLTLNSVVIMGYNTYMSLPHRPLKKRVNIVITHHQIDDEGVIVSDDLDSVLDEYAYGMKDAWVIGGESIYRQAIDKCNMMYITRFNKKYEADAFFPLDKDDHRWEDWHMSYAFNGKKPEYKNEPMCRFLIYEREMVSRHYE